MLSSCASALADIVVRDPWAKQLPAGNSEICGLFGLGFTRQRSLAGIAEPTFVTTLTGDDPRG
jgi:hypothetical protein